VSLSGRKVGARQPDEELEGRADARILVDRLISMADRLERVVSNLRDADFAGGSSADFLNDRAPLAGFG
jgi:hypothetical protein